MACLQTMLKGDETKMNQDKLCHAEDHAFNQRSDQGVTMLKCQKCPLEVTVIPKDCVVCDVCNRQLSDENFVATADSYWYEGDLLCQNCKTKYPREPHELKMKILTGDDLSNTELAKPMMMENW